MSGPKTIDLRDDFAEQLPDVHSSERPTREITTPVEWRLALARVNARVRHMESVLADRRREEKLTLVGHMLSGLFAREGHTRHPDFVIGNIVETAERTLIAVGDPELFSGDDTELSDDPVMPARKESA